MTDFTNHRSRGKNPITGSTETGMSTRVWLVAYIIVRTILLIDVKASVLHVIQTEQTRSPGDAIRLSS